MSRNRGKALPFLRMFLCTGVCISTICHAAQSAKVLYVFYPTSIRPHIVQQQLSQALPDLRITVFGRHRDFLSKVESSPPDAIITKPVVLEKPPGYAVRLMGSKQGNTKEPYVLLSLNKITNIKELQNKKIGAVDLLGRKDMQDFVSYFVKFPAKVKRVTKVEDLLPLLTFRIADALCISQPHADQLQKMSKTNLVITKLPKAETHIIALAVRNKTRNFTFVEKVEKLGPELLSYFDIDKWKRM